MLILVVINIIIIIILLLLLLLLLLNYRCVKFANLSDELPWRFLRRILHVLIHDEWHWHWQKAATLTLKNQENDKYSHLEQNITTFVVEIGIGIAQTKSHYGSCPDLMQFWLSFLLLLLFFFFEWFNLKQNLLIAKFPLLPFNYLFIVTLFWFLTKIKSHSAITRCGLLMMMLMMMMMIPSLLFTGVYRK